MSAHDVSLSAIQTPIPANKLESAAFHVYILAVQLQGFPEPLLIVPYFISCNRYPARGTLYPPRLPVRRLYP